MCRVQGAEMNKSDTKKWLNVPHAIFSSDVKYLNQLRKEGKRQIQNKPNEPIIEFKIICITM